MTKDLDAIRWQLHELAEKESIRVWRLARRAEAKGCSAELVNAIRSEGFALHNEYTAYPERLIAWNTKDRLKYAFCGERIRHTYLTIGVDSHEIINIEYK